MKLKLESFRKKSVWVAIVSFVLLLCKTYKVFQVPDGFDMVVDSGLSLLTVLGILIDG